MLFIKPETRRIVIPRHGNIDTEFKLILKHNVTGQEYVFDNLMCEQQSSKYWNFIDLDFSILQTGEYTYNLNGVETGLLQVDTDLTDPVSYDNEKTIIQYE